MFGFGPRLGSVFASRWKALFWAAGIIFTAYTLVPSPEDKSQTAANQKAAAALKNVWSKNSGEQVPVE